MDQQNMNERAFSHALANDTKSEITNAYALNKTTDDDNMFDRPMPSLYPISGSGVIPPAPPLPEELRVGGKMAADLY